MARSSGRYIVLDSYRALAALYVVAFHYFYRWTSAVVDDPLTVTTPLLSSSQIVSHGYLGVEFFFIISGFVIALTLRKTQTIADFFVNRFARLFPAMFVCAIVTFVVVKILGVSPFSDVSLIDFIPSLSFISPHVINRIFGTDTDWISSVYWSLFVEIKFYVMAAVIYFLAPRRFMAIFFTVACVLCVIYWTAVANGWDMLQIGFELAFFPKYAFLFVAGMAFNDLHSGDSKSRSISIGMILFSLVYSVTVNSPLNPVWPGNLVAMAVILAFFVLFFLFIVDSAVLRPLESRILVKIGAASYSLYLLHESIGVSAINVLNQYLGAWLVWPFVVITAVIAISLVFYDKIETPARGLIRNAFYRRT